MSEMDGFTACILTYGNHVDYLERCLYSIRRSYDPRLLRSIRIGLNAASPAAKQLVHDAVADIPEATQVLVFDADDHNRLKYPMMRKMFYDQPIVTQFVTWFDDDSAIANPGEFWPRVYATMGDCDMLGAVYLQQIRGRQSAGIRAQPWYTGSTIIPTHRFRFATGGWWTARWSMLQRHDYPWRDLKHNGGDTTLGEMIRQQGFRLAQVPSGLVMINADMTTQKDSKAPRRGESQYPVWYDYNPNDVPDHSQHDFTIVATDPRRPHGETEQPKPATPQPAKTRSPGLRRIPGL